MDTRKITIPSHTYEPTSNKNVCRFVDREGNWTHYWIKSKKIFVPAVNHVIKLGFPKSERFYQYLLSVNTDEAERRLKTAGEEGSRTHNAIRDLVAGKRITLETTYFNDLKKVHEPLTPDEWNNLEAFITWCSKYNPQVLLQEYTVWSEQYPFAGTLDFLGTIEIPEGEKNIPKDLYGKIILVLIDWKTSSGIWDEYELQTAAYRKALFEKSPYKPLIKRYGGLWTSVVRLGTMHKSGYEMKLWDHTQSNENFELFVSTYHLYKRKAGDQAEPELKQIPVELAVKIPFMGKEKKKSND
jgi:hypothetical protein